MTPFVSALPPVGSKTLIYGHRGAMAYRPQNTMQAFHLAWRMGAAGIELDVQCTRDGVVLVYHDDFLHTLTNATQQQIRLKDCTADYLLGLDVGTHFAAEYAHLRMPTLEEVLWARPPNSFVNIELKAEMSFTGNPNAARFELSPETDVAAALEARRVATQTALCIQNVAAKIPDLPSHIIVSSFHPAAIETFHELMPNIAIGQLFSSDTTHSTNTWMSSIAHCALHLNVQEIDAATIEQAHRAGLYVNCWTVNQVADAQRLIDWGVDGIITNTPDVMLELL